MERTVEKILDELCTNLEYRFGSREFILSHPQPNSNALAKAMELVREARAMGVGSVH
jgi:hypothetical protein